MIGAALFFIGLGWTSAAMVSLIFAILFKAKGLMRVALLSLPFGGLAIGFGLALGGWPFFHMWWMHFWPMMWHWR